MTTEEPTPLTCPTCEGAGFIPVEAPRGSGLDYDAIPCPTCTETTKNTHEEREEPF